MKSCDKLFAATVAANTYEHSDVANRLSFLYGCKDWKVHVE